MTHAEYYHAYKSMHSVFASSMNEYGSIYHQTICILYNSYVKCGSAGKYWQNLLTADFLQFHF